MANRYKEQIIIDGANIQIHGFDASAKAEFFKKVGKLVQVVPEKKYKELFEGISVGGYASYHAELFDVKNAEIWPKRFKLLKSPKIVVNADKFPNDNFIEASIQHELAELWILSKLGFSVYSMYLSQKMSMDQTIKLAHLYARKHEYEYALEHGFIEDYYDWQYAVNFSGKKDNEAIYQKIIRRANRE